MENVSMKDIAGNVLEIGDYVCSTLPNYKNLGIGKVVGFTPKQVRIVGLTKQGFNSPSSSFCRYSKDVSVLKKNDEWKNFPDEWVVELMKKN